MTRKVFYSLMLVTACTSAAFAQSLVGAWRLESFGPIGEESPVLPGTEIFILFGETKHLQGSSGCNSYSAVYETGEVGSITFDRFGASDQACFSPDGIMAQGNRYEDTLVQVSGFDIDGDRLTLLYNDGQGVFSFALPAGPATSTEAAEWRELPDAGDLNEDGQVDEADYEAWRAEASVGIPTATSTRSWGAIKSAP